jgi:transposase
MWTLHNDDVIAYAFSDSRSSQTAKDLLDGTTGFLHVDGYSAYNAVCGEHGRERVGCWSHARRLFFKALSDDEAQARTVLNWVVDLYLVEYEAAHRGILGTANHLELRLEKSVPILNAIKTWLDENNDRYPPKSRLGKAIGYAQHQWTALTTFTKDPRLRLDNNLSENALRIVALGRKNFLFVGHEEGGKNLATLQTIVATCRLHDVNPYAYIKDVLIRIQSHPQSKIDELLPQQWKHRFVNKT